VTFRSSQLSLLECGKEAPSDAVVATDTASIHADCDNGIVLQGELGCYGRDGDATHRVGAMRWTSQAVYLPGRNIFPAPGRLLLLAHSYCATTFLGAENSEVLPPGPVAVAVMF
jgi:hypothetical protein